MDPDATLADIRWTMKDWYAGRKDIDLDEILTLIDGLDEWISKGGFLPSSWRK